MSENQKNIMVRHRQEIWLSDNDPAGLACGVIDVYEPEIKSAKKPGGDPGPGRIIDLSRRR